MRKGLFTDILLSVCSLFALLFLLEIGVRYLSPSPSMECAISSAYPDRFDSEFGFFGKSNLSTRFVLHEFDIEVKTNSLGFRDEDFHKKLDASDGAKRVVFLGDSFTWGWGVEKHQRFSEIVANELGSSISFNLGQSGFGTGQELLVYEKFGTPLSPKLVILGFVFNDFCDARSPERYEQAKPYFELLDGEPTLRGVPVAKDNAHWDKKNAHQGVAPGWVLVDGVSKLAKRCSWAKGVLTNFHLYNWITRKIRGLSQPPEGNSTRREKFECVEPVERSLVFKLVQKLNAQIENSGGSLLVALFPTLEQARDSSVSKKWQADFMDFCAWKNINCLDLASEFQGRSDAYFQLDPHWNVAGHLIAGRAISRAVLELDKQKQVD